ncbi:MAG TPA: hypothetical protein VH079_17625, partial [Terriglobales bacterium]|nr:hypothetical protein [Terriglobales bacterium]
EKYENYRLHLSRWCREAGEGPDLCPTIYNLIDSLAQFLEINRYSSHNTTQPKFLMDLLPEVYGPSSKMSFHWLLTRGGFDDAQIAEIARHVDERGCIYLPHANVIYVQDFQMGYAAEEAARFLHHACRGLPLLRNGSPIARTAPVDRFYARMLEHALAYFGSRVLFPARASVGMDDLTRAAEQFAQEAVHSSRIKFDSMARDLGYGMGSELYDRYLSGRVRRVALRRLFLSDLEKPGAARKAFLKIAVGSRSRK